MVKVTGERRAKSGAKTVAKTGAKTVAASAKASRQTASEVPMDEVSTQVQDVPMPLPASPPPERTMTVVERPSHAEKKLISDRYRDQPPLKEQVPVVPPSAMQPSTSCSRVGPKEELRQLSEQVDLLPIRICSPFVEHPDVNFMLYRLSTGQYFWAELCNRYLGWLLESTLLRLK